MKNLIPILLASILPLSAVASEWTTHAFVYDGSGNIVRIGDDQYVYDRAGRLAKGTANGTAHRQEYTYDSFGNRLSVRTCVDDVCTLPTPLVMTGTTNHVQGTSYGDAGNVDTFSGQQYTFDAAEMISADSSHEYIYTADDQRIAVHKGTDWQWSVRDLGQRVARDFTSSDTSTTWTAVEDYVHTERGAAGTVSAQGRRHLHLDHLGTPRLITTADARQAGLHTYYPFGEELSLPNESPQERLKFTGHERDDSGLDYMHARYYRAGDGRFLAVDQGSYSISEPQSWNRYAYVRNNPMNTTDPTGMDPCTMKLPNGTETQGECVTVEAKQPSVIAEVIEDTVDHSAFDVFNMLGGGNIFMGLLHDDPVRLAKGYGQQLAWAAPGGIASGLRPLAASGDVVFSGTTTLFRSMSQAELEQVLAEGAFKAGPNSLEGKWFAETLEHANQWGDLMGNPRTVSVEMPTSIAKWLMRLDRLDGIGPARWAEMRQLFQTVVKAAR